MVKNLTSLCEVLLTNRAIYKKAGHECIHIQGRLHLLRQIDPNLYYSLSRFLIIPRGQFPGD